MGTPRTDSVRDELRSRLLQNLSDSLKRRLCDPLVSINPLKPTNGDDGDMGALGKLSLFKTQKSTGGANLFGRDVHD